ncbi:MAG: 6-bladed beta-propeller [Flavobacteriales bacterium]
MNRRKFIINTSIAGIGMAVASSFSDRMLLHEELIIGHNTHRYKVDMNWGALNATKHPVNDCHEMVQDSKGRIVMLTNHTKNNVIIYNKKGKLKEVWGTEYPGAHGLTLNVEGGEDFLYITDTVRNEVIKTTIKGKEVQRFSYPKQSGAYYDPEQYKPTETAVHSSGDVYVADGYGQQLIHHYNSKGELLNSFGGYGEEDDKFFNAHGICIDSRDAGNPELLITARMKNQLKRFTLEGKYIDSIDLPGCYICRPVIHGKNVYLATIWSGDKKDNSGFVSILDENNKLISAPGGSEPIYEKGELIEPTVFGKPFYTRGPLKPMYQTLELFKHPHDVCVDEDENLYVCQWNSGKSYPIKLIRQ